MNSLSESDSRFVRVVAFAAQNCSTDLRLKRNMIVLAAVVADDLEFVRRIVARTRFFRTAFRTSLRLHHISLVENFLLFFRKKKDFFALNTRNFYIRHRFSPSLSRFNKGVVSKV
jgi:hypothetical protein